MKKILLITVLFCTSLTANIYAQCTPDPTIIANNSAGLFPSPTDGIASGTIGTAYAQTLTMIVPADTTIAIPPAPATTLTVNTATITGVTGLPAGLVSNCAPSSCIYPGGTNGCAIFEGTPTAFGTFTVTVTVVVNVEAPFIGATNAPAQDIVYTLTIADTATGGCTMTAVASAGNETVAGANDGSASVVASGGTGPYVYLWSTGETGFSISGLAPGTYTVQVWDADTTCNTTETVTVLAGPVSVNTISGSSFEVFPVTPNPASDKAEIRFITPDYRNVSISVYNMIGATVISKQIYSEQGMNIVSLSSSALNPGVYFVTLTDGENSTTKRMVVGAR